MIEIAGKDFSQRRAEQIKCIEPLRAVLDRGLKRCIASGTGRAVLLVTNGPLSVELIVDDRKPVGLRGS